MTTPLPPQPRSLLGMTVEELSCVLESPARARATLRWLHGLQTLPPALPDVVPGVCPEAWSKLRQACDLRMPTLRRRDQAADGTIKYVLEVEGGGLIESVLIPGRGRSTLCVSSQVGCTRRCAFCATARLGFGRNLLASEIVAQYLLARPDAPADGPLRNVVFMGMGEPMDNLDEVFRAIDVLTAAPMPQLAAAHITVSTSGVLPGMLRFLREGRANLALSLHGTTDAQREGLMPQNRVWPIEKLLEPLRADAARTPPRFHFFEYILWDGVNDSEEDACRLLRLLEGIRARVNLLAHNAFEGCELRPAARERIERFRDIVLKGGVRCMIRHSRGSDIAAACGQLARKQVAGA